MKHSLRALRVCTRNDGVRVQRQRGEEAGEGVLDAGDRRKQLPVKKEPVCHQIALLQEHSLLKIKLLDGPDYPLITNTPSLNIKTINSLYIQGF